MFAVQLSREARALGGGALAWAASGLAVLDVVGLAALIFWPA